MLLQVVDYPAATTLLSQFKNKTTVSRGQAVLAAQKESKLKGQLNAKAVQSGAKLLIFNVAFYLFKKKAETIPGIPKQVLFSNKC